MQIDFSADNFQHGDKLNSAENGEKKFKNRDRKKIGLRGQFVTRGLNSHSLTM
jgi:hypothetical protein